MPQVLGEGGPRLICVIERLFNVYCKDDERPNRSNITPLNNLILIGVARDWIAAPAVWLRNAAGWHVLAPWDCLPKRRGSG